MKALALDAEARSAHVWNVPIPHPGRDEVLIHVKAVALNPVDTLYTFKPLGKTGRIVGSDFAGIVVATGEDPGSTFLGPNTRVAGFLQGACSVNERPGAFAEYLICPVNLLWKVPESLSFEEAATISLCALTAAQALFYRLQLPTPFEWEMSRNASKTAYLDAYDTDPALNVFIYGAPTSVALFAAQLLQHFSSMSNRKSASLGRPANPNFLFYNRNHIYTILWLTIEIMTGLSKPRS
jgi:NADPH:quinone reductase-like Zn-dependent oxidoreductase